MHDGRVKELQDAVKIMTKYQLGRYMEKGDIEVIVAFLKSLTGELPQIVGEK
jgi:cytochrome c peroxidase